MTIARVIGCTQELAKPCVSPAAGDLKRWTGMEIPKVPVVETPTIKRGFRV